MNVQARLLMLPQITTVRTPTGTPVPTAPPGPIAHLGYTAASPTALQLS
jgi:hypothetical protein